MPRFPAVKYRDVIRVAKKLGFSFYRMGKGNHEIWGRETDARTAVIPCHPGKVIKRKTLKSILESFQISAKDFMRLKKGK